MDLKEGLEALRKHLTWKAIAGEIHVDVISLRRWRRGENTPHCNSLDKLIRLAALHEIDINL